jgi:hypothetical protein
MHYARGLRGGEDQGASAPVVWCSVGCREMVRDIWGVELFGLQKARNVGLTAVYTQSHLLSYGSRAMQYARTER